MAADAVKSEPQSDEPTKALIELDAAWQAYGQLKQTVESQRQEIAALRSYRRMERPKEVGFERISTAIWHWSNSSPEAQEVNAPQTIRRISKIIVEARAKKAKIADMQKKERDA